METVSQTADDDHTYRRLNDSESESANGDIDSTRLKTMWSPYETETVVQATDEHIYRRLNVSQCEVAACSSDNNATCVKTVLTRQNTCPRTMKQN